MNAEIEALIARLRKEGTSKVQSIVKVASAFGLGMEAAKKAVHESPTWSAEKAGHEEFQRQLDKSSEPPPASSPPTPDS